MGWKHILRGTGDAVKGVLSMYGAYKGLAAMGSEIYAVGRGIYTAGLVAAPLLAAA